MSAEQRGSRKMEDGSRKLAEQNQTAPDSRLPATLLFRMPLSLRWRDLDAFNHVNNATFMTYLEEARIRWFDSLGSDWVTEAFAPLLAAVQMNYRQPIAYPADIVVELACERVGNTSLTIGHRIVADGGDAAAGEPTVHADGNVVIVWIDRVSGRPTALPDLIRKAVEA